jgi:NitT/TauT family transport system substrate-binding protein
MAAHKNGSAIIANQNINSISELDGKNVGIPSRFSSHYFILDKLINKHGIKVNLIDMAPTEMPFALLTGRLDAYIVAEPFGQLAVKYEAKNLIFSKDIEPNHICCLLNFTSELIHSSIAKELIASFKSAAKFANSSPSKAAVSGAKILGQELNIIDDTIQKGIISYSDLSVSKSQLEELKQFLIRVNLASNELKKLDISSYLESLI